MYFVRVRTAAVDGTLSRLRRVEYACRMYVGRCAVFGKPKHRGARTGKAVAPERNRSRSGCASFHRYGRIRPRVGRRRGKAFRRSYRGRAGHRKIHLTYSDGRFRVQRRERGARFVCFRRRGRLANTAPLRQARLKERRHRNPVYEPFGRYRKRIERAQSRVRHRRFHTNRFFSRSGRRSGYDQSIKILRCRIDLVGKGARRRAFYERARYKRRFDCRPQSARTLGGYGYFV